MTHNAGTAAVLAAAAGATPTQHAWPEESKGLKLWMVIYIVVCSCQLVTVRRTRKASSPTLPLAQRARAPRMRAHSARTPRHAIRARTRERARECARGALTTCSSCSRAAAASCHDVLKILHGKNAERAARD